MTKGQNKHGVSQPKAKTLYSLKPTAEKRLHNKIFGTVYFGTQLSLLITLEHFTLCHKSTDPFRLQILFYYHEISHEQLVF